MDNQRIAMDKRTISKRPLKQGLKSCKPMIKPRLTQKMKQARYHWGPQHENRILEDWSKMRYLIEIKSDYRITFLMLIMFF